MQQDILIIGVLFPAIPLMMINFGNRYTVLAHLIRNLHDTVIRDGTSIVDAARFLKQISSLRHRLRLIGFIQTMSALGFMLALSAMIASYLSNLVLSSWLFFLSILLMMVAMVVFMREIQLGNTALDVHLSDLEDHQEWQHLLHPPKRQKRSKKSKAAAKSS